MSRDQEQLGPFVTRIASTKRRSGGYLETKLPEVGRLLGVQQFEGGQSNPTFLLECSAARLGAAQEAAG